MAKKSFYLLLTSLLGALLFLIIHRAAIFIYLYLVANGSVATELNYWQFLAYDYVSLIVVLFLGSWYGIWLGLYWFDKVYVEKTHKGFVHHLSGRLFSSRPKNLENRLATVKENLEKDLWQLEDLAKASIKPEPEPIKRKLVRKRAPKKLNSLK